MFWSVVRCSRRQGTARADMHRAQRGGLRIHAQPRRRTRLHADGCGFVVGAATRAPLFEVCQSSERLRSRPGQPRTGAELRRTLLPTAPSPLVADAIKVEPVTDKLRGSSRGRISRLREWRNGRRDGFRCHCPMGVGVRIPPRALYEGGLQPRASAHLMPPTRVRPASRTAVDSTGGR